MNLRKQLYLIGKRLDTITDKKFQQIKKLLLLTKNLNQSIDNMMINVILEVKNIWSNAAIPTQDN